MRRATRGFVIDRAVSYDEFPIQINALSNGCQAAENERVALANERKDKMIPGRVGGRSSFFERADGAGKKRNGA